MKVLKNVVSARVRRCLRSLPNITGFAPDGRIVSKNHCVLEVHPYRCTQNVFLSCPPRAIVFPRAPETLGCAVQQYHIHNKKKMLQRRPVTACIPGLCIAGCNSIRDWGISCSSRYLLRVCVLRLSSIGRDGNAADTIPFGGLLWPASNKHSPISPLSAHALVGLPSPVRSPRSFVCRECRGRDNSLLPWSRVVLFMIAASR